MRKSTYQTRLDQVLDCPQFSRIDASDDIITKIEMDINSTLKEMKKLDLICKKIYQKLRSTGAKFARFYGLAKLQKKDSPLRPALSIPGSPYHNLKKLLTPLFERVPGANIETSKLQAREKLESVQLEENKQKNFLDVKSLHTNVPDSEAIEIALRSLYSSDNAPDIERSTIKLLLKLAVHKFPFKSKDNWYCEKGCLAMGATLAVVLAKIWKKSFEEKLSDESQTPSVRIKDPKEKCPDCHRKIA